MKLIKIKDDHYVVVTDELIEWRDYFLNTIQKEVYCHDIENYDVNKHYLKKITHSTQPLEKFTYDNLSDEVFSMDYHNIKPLSLQEVKELIGEVDVEKKAFEYTSASQAHRRGFIDGYNQALKDNKEKKYTEAQLIWAIQEAYGHGQDDEFDGVFHLTESIEAITKYLQPKTQWEYIGECKGNNGNGCFMDSPGHDCGCYKRVPKTSWEVEIVDGKLKLK